MPSKKKGGGDKKAAKKGGGVEDDVNYLEDFMKFYRKEVQKYEDLTMCDQIKKMYEQAIEDGEE